MRCEGVGVAAPGDGGFAVGVRRCRRLILVSTGTGSIMIPGKPSVLAKMMTPRRFMDHRYAALVAPELYGGAARRNPILIKHVFDRQLMTGSWLG
jgi:hypothetical protein